MRGLVGIVPRCIYSTYKAAQRYTHRFHLPALPAIVEDAKSVDCTTCFFFTASSRVLALKRCQHDTKDLVGAGGEATPTVEEYPWLTSTEGSISSIGDSRKPV